MLESLPSFARLVAELGKLPGVGQKTSMRLAFHLLRGSNENVEALATALREMKQNLRFCRQCCNISETELCTLCSNSGRDHARLCIVQEPQDLFAIEKSGGYRGLYHVLNGVLSPLDNIGPEDLTIPQLLQRIAGEPLEEVVIATSFSVEGEATAIFLQHEMKAIRDSLQVTRLALGIPMGSDLEHIDSTTVQRAINSRREF